MTFYERYKELCSKKGESPTKAAANNGIGGSTVTAWKNGSFPKGETVYKLANYFGVSADYLLTGEEPTYTAIRSSDEEVEIFEAINALKDTELRRLVLRLSKASDEEIRKVHGFLDLTQIGGSYGS